MSRTLTIDTTSCDLKILSSVQNKIVKLASENDFRLNELSDLFEVAKNRDFVSKMRSLAEFVSGEPYPKWVTLIYNTQKECCGFVMYGIWFKL